MARKSRIKTPITEQAPTIRKSNSEEVCLGYTLTEGQEEAIHCLQCKNASCITKRPVITDTPGFILAIREGNVEQIADILSRYTNLPAIYGCVYPQEKRCKQVCKLRKAKNFELVAIGKLGRLVTDWASENHKLPKKTAESTKGRVAVVDFGPSGLTVTGDLIKLDYEVIIFEALHEVGGILTYDIPKFRLSKKIVKQEIASTETLGVTIEINVVVGKTITMEEVMSESDACYLPVSVGTPNFMGIPGASLNGVYSSSEFLTRINLAYSYEFPECDTPIGRARNVVMISGGNVAIDTAHSVKRLGAGNVNIVYRRSLEELPAKIEEYHHSLEEGISYYWLTDPIAYSGDQRGNLADVEYVKMVLGEPDMFGRRRPEPVPDSTFIIPADAVIEVIGRRVNRALLSAYPGIELNQWDYIQTGSKTGATSIPGVFVRGDIVTGAATVISAMGAGKIIANAINQCVKTQKTTVVSNVQER